LFFLLNAALFVVVGFIYILYRLFDSLPKH
jgi:hypothetical protein